MEAECTSFITKKKLCVHSIRSRKRMNRRSLQNVKKQENTGLRLYFCVIASNPTEAIVRYSHIP